MPQSLVKSAAERSTPTDRRIYGVAIAQVIGNVDAEGLGRVQVRLPWLRGFEPWARLVSTSGTYFVPQEGDEVLVAFSHGDVREPYVVGCLWNHSDRPPSSIPTDSRTKRILTSPGEHEIVLDDLTKSISITNSTKHRVDISVDKIEISTAKGAGSIVFGATGEVSIKSSRSITLNAPNVSVEGGTVDVKGSTTTTITGAGTCNVRGAAVNVN